MAKRCRPQLAGGKLAKHNSRDIQLHGASLRDVTSTAQHTTRRHIPGVTTYKPANRRKIV